MENDVLMYIDGKLQVFRNRYWDDIGTNFKSVVRQSLSDVSQAEGSLSVESVTQAQRQRLPSSPQKGLDQEQDSLGKDLGDLGVHYIC